MVIMGVVQLMYMPQIGERIRFLRTRQNLSQSALAEKLSVSKSVVSLMRPAFTCLLTIFCCVSPLFSA